MKILRLCLPLVLAALILPLHAEPQRLSLWDGKAPNGDGAIDTADTFITVHRAEKPNGAAVVICPGGGYTKLVVEGEGHGIAKWLNGHGITGIVLEYRLPAQRKLVPMLDVQRALRTARLHAEEWKIDPKRLGVIGFSAGGHVASTAGTHYDNGTPDSPDPVMRMGCRPDFMILLYPVITMDIPTRGKSRIHLLGEDADQETVDFFSNEKHVTADTPPVFLCYPLDDEAVPPEHSRLFRKALQAAGVPCEVLELPDGGHGLKGKGPRWDEWQAAALKWLAVRKITG